MNDRDAISPAATASWVPLVTLLTAAGALLYLWFGWCVFPLSDWNEIRLAPAFALRHGYPLYPSAEGGPLSTWIYGPVGVIVNLPATWAASPIAAIQVSGAINLLLLGGPLAWFVLRSPALEAAGIWAQLAALAVGVLLTAPTALVFYAGDHAAIACGLLSCWCLTRSPSPPSTANVAQAAGWCVLAIAAKQTSVFLPVAHVIFLAGDPRARGAAVRYVAFLAALGGVAGLLLIGSFGARELWLNLVEIPARLPWGDMPAKLAHRYPSLLAYVVAPLAFLAFHWRHLRIQPTDTVESRFCRCTSLAFLALLPIGLMSFFKIGGDMNVLHSWPYFLPGLLLFALPRFFRDARTLRWLPVPLLAALALRGPEFAQTPPSPLTAHLEHAGRIAGEGRGTTWFPNNPLVGFYTNGTLHHVEDGIATRHLAGLALRQESFRAHLPAPLNTVVYPAANENPFALQLLDLKRRTPAGHWALYTR